MNKENEGEANMTERERILAILNGKQPDQVPWCADLAYYIQGLNDDGIYPKEYESTHLDNGLQQMHRDYGIGFYLQGFSPLRAEHKGGVEFNTVHKGSDMESTITTPIGTLTQKQSYSKLSYSWGITKHYIEDIDDLKIFAYMVKNTTYIADYEFAKKRYETIGDNGIVLCYTPKSPLMDLLALHAGVENLTYMIADDEEEFDEIIAEMEEKYDEACKIVVESPAECIMIPENISSECVVPFYHKYMKNFHRKWTDKIREAGKHSFVHLDGSVKGLVHELSHYSKFDVIEAITPMPVGDIEFKDVAAMVDPETIIWGGIPGGMFHKETTTEQDFEEHVKMIIEIMASSPRYVLGVADQVVPCSDVKRIKRVRELVDLYGTYK